MADDIAAWLVGRDEQLYNDDSTWRAHMGEIAEVIRPLRKELTGTTGTAGEKRMQKVFDSTAINALNNLASGLFGSASNPAEVWFTMSLVDKDRAKWGPVRDWLQRQSRKLLMSCGPTYSAFYAQVPSLYLDFAGFGSGIFSSELRADHSGFKDLARSLSTHNFDVDDEGVVNTMFVRRRISADNAAAEFGKDNLSDKVKAKVGDKNKTEFDFLQAVVPNAEYMAGLFGFKGKSFASFTIERESKHIVKRSGFNSFPYFVPRWEVAECERKGRGPGEYALPDAKSLNVMTKTNLKAGERAGDPPWGAPDEGNISVIRTAPGKVTYGAVDRNGNQLLKPLVTGGGTPFSLEMANQLREAIKDYFYFSLMQLVGRTGMTATEVIERNEEKMRLMAPYLGRLQSEFLAKFIMRRWELLQLVPGVVEPPPPDLQGHTPVVEFVSAAALAQKSARGAGVMRFYQAAGPILATDPLAAAKVNGEKALEIVGDAFGVPEIINDDDTTAKNRQAIAQQLQAQQAAQVAQPAARAAKDGADAVATLRDAGKAAA